MSAFFITIRMLNVFTKISELLVIFPQSIHNLPSPSTFPYEFAAQIAKTVYK